MARDRTHEFLKRQAKKKNTKTKHFQFSENDLVLVKAQNMSNAGDRKIAKFFHVYEGPYLVKRIIALDTYQLIDYHSNKERGKFHITNLKPYVN